MITVATIAAVLAALSVRLFYDNREWAALAEEMQDENDGLRQDTNELCKEKMSLIIDKEKAEDEAANLKLQLDDALTAYENSEKERISLKEQLAKAENDFAEKGKGKVSKAEQSTDIPLLPPEGVHTNTFRCEDYRLFVKNSQQAMLQEECHTAYKSGVRYLLTEDNYYYCAAMGGAYGTQIGQAYAVQLRNGTVFNVVLADYKHPIDNASPYDYGDNDTNYDGDDCICVIEFVVDMDAVPQEVKQAGTMSVMPEMGGLYGYGGDIVKIEKLERVWCP
jgi:hypothetical protein